MNRCVCLRVGLLLHAVSCPRPARRASHNRSFASIVLRGCDELLFNYGKRKRFVVNDA